MTLQKPNPKTERLEARLTAEQRALIERAAAYEGRSISEFVIGAAQAAAREIIERHEIIRLSETQSRLLVELLVSSPEPNAALRAAKEAHDRNVVSQRSTLLRRRVDDGGKEADA